MEITLEKIDAVRERTGVSYKEAKEALEKCNGDVVEALIYLEEEDRKETKEKGKWTETITVAGSEVVDSIKELIKQGNITKIRVKKDNKVIMDLPVTAGAIGTILAPQLAALGTVVALISKCTIEVERPEKGIINLNEIIAKKAEEAKGFVEDLAGEAKDFVGEIKKKGKKDKEDVDKDQEI